MGGFGRYQKRAFTIITLCFAMGSYSLYPMGYYELQPEYECAHYDEGQERWMEWERCYNTDFCPNLRPGG